jgi:hypothetical protein
MPRWIDSQCGAGPAARRPGGLVLFGIGANVHSSRGFILSPSATLRVAGLARHATTDGAAHSGAPLILRKAQFGTIGRLGLT